MRYLLLPLIALALPALAELRIDSLEDRRSDWETYRFPLLQGDAPAIARINTYLHAVELSGLPGRFQRSPFERVWPKGGEIWGVNSLDYSLEGQGPGFVSLSLSGEYTGAYTSQWQVSHSFDLGTGRPIGLAQLFDASGLEQLRELLRTRRVARLQAFLDSLPAAADPDSRSEDAEYLEGQRTMYRECLAGHRERRLDHDRLALGDEALILDAGSCANHASRALDELGDLLDSLPYRELAAGLTAYGRCLLLERRGDCVQPLQPGAPGVYRGLLGGRYPITLVIERRHADDSLSASYFYDRYATRIELSGRFVDGRYLLDEAGEPPARFELRGAAAGSLSGEWRQGDRPALRVQLTP